MDFYKTYQNLKSALSVLSPRERNIIKSRFGISITKPKTLKEVGKEFGVTDERIRQIEAGALEKMKNV